MGRTSFNFRYKKQYFYQWNHLKGKTIKFEEFNSTTLGGRFVDVTDETIVRSKVFYEFKSVKTVPPKNISQNKLKELMKEDFHQLISKQESQLYKIIKVE